jgi:hypothetical protein
VHQIRWFVDPDQALLRHLWLHQAGHAWTLCPAYLKTTHPEGNYPPCEICALPKTQKDSWKSEARVHFMLYGLVLESTYTDKYWHPGQSYVIVGQSGMRDAFEQMVKSLTDQDQETVANMFDPRVAGCATRVSVNKGARGSVDITLMRDRVVPPIELGPWYKPLTQCWISPVYSPSDYQKVLTAVKESRL